MGRKWLDNYGQEDNYNDSKISLPKGFVGQGYDISGRNYSPAWEGQFQSGGNVESKWEHSNTNGKLIPQSQLKDSELGYLKDWLSSPMAKKIALKREGEAGTDNLDIRLERLNDSNLEISTAEDLLKSANSYTRRRGEKFNNKDLQGTSYTSPSTKYGNIVTRRMAPENVILHEGSHQSTSGNNLLLKNDVEDILSRVRNDSGSYLSNPTEVHARLNVLRKELKDSGVVDPFKTPVSKEHLNKFLNGYKKPGEKSDKSLIEANSGELLNILNSQDDAVWLLNNIVSNQNNELIPIAQDGKNINYSELPYDEKDIKSFYNKMITSPWYKDRLIKNGYDKQYSIGVDKVIENRLKRVNDAKLDNVQKDDGALNQMYRFITSGELIEANSGSYYNPDTGNITMVESQMNKYKAHPRTILAHEYGHPEVVGGISRIEEGMLTKFNPTPTKKLTDHDKKPSENKSDINSLRYNLYKAKIFDPSTGNYKTKSKKFEQSLFEKVKDDASTKRLRNNYGDKQLINLINTVATNENNNIVSIAKDGKIIKDNNGYWNPKNWGKVVEIDSNDITMKGVNQPLLGISDEGDIQYMEPNKDYKFKGKKVREFPIARNGINNLDENSLQQLDQLTNFTNYNKLSNGGWLDKF